MSTYCITYSLGTNYGNYSVAAFSRKKAVEIIREELSKVYTVEAMRRMWIR